MLLLWLSALFLSKIQNSESNIPHSTVLVLATFAIGVTVYAIFFADGRTRENLMYARDNILAFVLLILIIQILEFMTMHALFGPWSIIIKNLIFDVVRFLCVLLLFIGGFALHMMVIYKPVYNKEKTYIPSSLTSLGRSKDGILSVFYDLFFALFGLTARPKPLSEDELLESPEITYQLATFVFAMYEIISIVVLVNLLIAMMSSTYTRIEERSEIEWKFGRARVIRSMTRSSSIPIPMTLIVVVVRIVKYIWTSKCICCSSTPVNNIFREIGDDEDDDDNKSNGKASSNDSFCDITEKGGLSRLHNVVPWSSVLKDYWESKGIETSASEMGNCKYLSLDDLQKDVIYDLWVEAWGANHRASQVYPLPWECILLIWMIGLFISQIADTEKSTIRLVNSMLCAISIGCHVAAVFSHDRVRENLMYTRDNVLAFALLLLTVQIFDFLSMHEVFGPWSVIMRNLMMDVVKFIVLLFMFILVFTAHMSVVYKPVYEKARVDFTMNVLDLNFQGGAQALFEELFFACFGMTNFPNFEFSKDSSPVETEYIAATIFGIYEIVVIIVLINLLIAMMSDTYVKIQERSEIEWKYGRGSIIWRMTKTDSVPNPINILTMFIYVSTILVIAKFVCCCFNVNTLFNEMQTNSVSSFDDGDKAGSADNKKKKDFQLDSKIKDDNKTEKKEAPVPLIKAVPWKDVVNEYRVFVLGNEEVEEKDPDL